VKQPWLTLTNNNILHILTEEVDFLSVDYIYCGINSDIAAESNEMPREIHRILAENCGALSCSLS